METMDAVAKVEEAAKLADSSVRHVEKIEIGQAVRQGDIYIHRVAANHARGKVRTGASARQLALGAQANARHIAEPPAVVYEGSEIPSTCATGTFLGPLVESDAPFTVSHPEHAAVCLPAGTYQVTHQMDARTLDRVED
jgi:hypothetical protein